MKTKWIGSWKLSFTVEKQNITSKGLCTFFEDGNVMADEIPMPQETSGHGSWVSTEANEGYYTFVSLFGNSEAGKWNEGTVSGKVKYDPKTDQWTGPYTIVLVDQDGNETFSDSGTMNATRISAR